MKRKLSKTEVDNPKLETEIREHLSMGCEISRQYLNVLLRMLESGTYLELKYITEVSRGITATRAEWIGEKKDWDKVTKDRNLIQIAIYRVGRNRLTLSRDKSRFIVNSI